MKNLFARCTCLHRTDVTPFRPSSLCLVGRWSSASSASESRRTAASSESGTRSTATFWKDVVVSGSNVGGRSGSLEIIAVSVKAVDGTDISLAGGYDQAGGDRYGLTRALSYILWPSAFLPGRRAVLDEGTVFDAAIPADTRISIAEGAVPTLKLTELPDLTVDIAYDEIAVRPILVAIITGERGDPCHVFRGRVNLESLREEFKPGINRFSVPMSGAEGSAVLNVQM